MDHADITYLDAKRTVDDRALAPRVRDRLLEELPSDPQILEAGTGTGTMIPRLVEWGVRSGSYHGVDRSNTLLEHANDRRAAELGAEHTPDGFRLADFDIRLEQGDALTVFEELQAEADLLIASAFLDLVPIETTLDVFEEAVRPAGLLYAPLTFDGGTIFQPDHPADAAVEAAYHEYIDEQPGRDTHAGRHVLESLRKRDGRLLSVGASDWIVRPRDGTYPAEEAGFLATILEFVADALDDHPAIDDWLDERRRQLDAAELSYVAHQYDFLYQSPAP
ncbi:MAG: class I SAM-dependent methyltransferase [Halobacteriales archaeon]